MKTISAILFSLTLCTLCPAQVIQYGPKTEKQFDQEQEKLMLLARANPKIVWVNTESYAKSLIKNQNKTKRGAL